MEPCGAAPMRRLVLLVDALHASAAAALRQALARFANVLAVSAGEPVELGLAVVSRAGTGVQLQVLYKPSCFMLRDFHTVLPRMREQDAWSAADTRKLVLALRSLVQHLRAGQAAHVPTHVAVLAHTFEPLPLLNKVLEEAAQASLCIRFVAVNTEASLAHFRPSQPAAAASGAGHAAAAASGAAGPGAAGSAALEAGGDGAAHAVVAASALGASEAFQRALSGAANADFSALLAEPLALEHLTMGWVRQLVQPLAPTEVELRLPPGTSAAAAGVGASGAGLDVSVVRCVLTSQLAQLAPRCTPCPLCSCHGVPTLPLPPQGPRVSCCAVDACTLLPPEAAPPDPLTVRVGYFHDLRLSGRGGPHQALIVDERPAYAGQPGASAGPVRLTAERVVRVAEVDEALLYGWPQLLMPSADEGAADTLGALCQVLQQGHAALVASSTASLCEGPGSHVAPTATSLKLWYLLLPGSGCLLLRQVACREQLVPLPPPPPRTATLPPETLAAAALSLSMLPGWAAPEDAQAGLARLRIAAGLATETAVAAGTAAAAVAAATPAEAVDAGGACDSTHGTAARPEDPGTAGPQLPPQIAPFTPVALSCGCHEVLAALLRDSVRLQPPPVPAPSGPPEGGNDMASGGGHGASTELAQAAQQRPGGRRGLRLTRG